MCLGQPQEVTSLLNTLSTSDFDPLRCVTWWDWAVEAGSGRGISDGGEARFVGGLVVSWGVRGVSAADGGSAWGEKGTGNHTGRKFSGT